VAREPADTPLMPDFSEAQRFLELLDSAAPEWVSTTYAYRAIAAAFGLPEGDPATPNNPKSGTSSGNLPSLSGSPAAVFATAARGYVIAVNAGTGLLPEHWVDELTANERSSLEKEIPKEPLMQPLAHSQRTRRMPL
jgi:hypothetical protein